jgi:hypothetical protein
MDRLHAEMGYSALAELGKDVTLYVIKGGDHGPDTCTIFDRPIGRGRARGSLARA